LAQKENYKLFYFNPHMLLCMAFWSFTVLGKHIKHNKVDEQAFHNPFNFHGSHGNTTFQFCFLAWVCLHGSLLKGAIFCLVIWWIFMALPYYASRGFPNFEI